MPVWPVIPCFLHTTQRQPRVRIQLRHFQLWYCPCPIIQILYIHVHLFRFYSNFILSDFVQNFSRFFPGFVHILSRFLKDLILILILILIFVIQIWLKKFWKVKKKYSGFSIYKNRSNLSIPCKIRFSLACIKDAFWGLWLFWRIFFYILNQVNWIYRKVASSNTSHLEAHAVFFRLLMKGSFDLYVLWPFDKKLIS